MYLPTPKKPRATVVREDSVEAVVSTKTHESKLTRAARAASALAKPAGQITKQELQAVLDDATLTYLDGKQRMIVTDKEFSVLKKRMKEDAPESLKDFVRQTVSNWQNIVAGQRAADRKRSSANGTAQRPMSLAPSFKDLAYRYPYFLAAYRNRTAEARYNGGKTAEQAEIARLNRAVVAAKEETKKVSALLRRRKVTPQEDSTLRSAAVRSARVISTGRLVGVTSTDVLDDIPLPTWEEQQAKRRGGAK